MVHFALLGDPENTSLHFQTDELCCHVYISMALRFDDTICNSSSYLNKKSD